MAYVDPTFNIHFQETVVGGGPHAPVLLGTITASATQTYIQSNTGTVSNGCFLLPRFLRPTAISSIQVYALGAATASGISGVAMYFTTLNSTNTATFTDSYGTRTVVGVNPPFGTVNIGTSTIGQMFMGTVSPVAISSTGVTTSPAWLTGTNVTPVMVVCATGTASGSSLGSYAVDFEYNNLFVS